MEMNDNYQFIISTGLEKGMLNVGEGDINCMSLA
jgi:hypothetical protein